MRPVPGGLWNGFGNPGKSMPGGKKDGIPGGRSKLLAACEAGGLPKGFLMKNGEGNEAGRNGEGGVAIGPEDEALGDSVDTLGDSDCFSGVGVNDPPLVGISCLTTTEGGDWLL